MSSAFAFSPKTTGRHRDARDRQRMQVELECTVYAARAPPAGQVHRSAVFFKLDKTQTTKEAVLKP